MKKNKIQIITLLIIIVVIVIIGITLNANINGNKENENSSLGDELDENGKVYGIEGKDFNLFEVDPEADEEYQGIKLFEYDDTHKNYAEIYYVSYDYYTDYSSTYNLMIRDEDGNSLLLNDDLNKYGEETLYGGEVRSTKIKKMDLDSKIIFEVIERDYTTGEKTKKSDTTIDLSSDLAVKVEIDQSDDQIEETLEDVSFKHTYDENYYRGDTGNAYSKALVGEDISWTLKSQYGNTLVPDEHIDFSFETNVNNLSLEEAFEDYLLINNNLGQYGLSDVYGINITDENGDFTGEEFTVTFEQMLKFANGETVEIDGKKYTKEDFEFADMEFEKVSDVEIGNGISAIKYKSNYDDSCIYYMFTYDNDIYYITCPTSKRVEKVVEMFIESLEVSGEK